MGLERKDSAGWGTEQREQQQELLDSLRGAVATLSICLDRLHTLIDRIDALGAEGPPDSVLRRAQVTFGGGESLLGGREHRRRLDPQVARSEVAHREDQSDPGWAQVDDRRRGAERRSGREAFNGVDRRAAAAPAFSAEPPVLRSVSDDSPRPRLEHRRVGTPELMAVSEMAHLGYNREEIAERLRERWGDETAAILREALD